MKKSKIYTKTGDKGETGLVGGTRISKGDSRIDLYGEVDELNSRVGFACSLLDVKHKAELDFLRHMQSALFDLGSNLACEVENRAKFNLPQITPALVQKIELEIDRMDEKLEPLKNFILPGGSPGPAAFHLCRTSARNVERKMISYHNENAEKLPEHSLEFMNRLSDYFFVASRYFNRLENGEEIAWKARG